MDSFNQYAAPESANILHSPEESLGFKELKKLYSWSRSIGALMVLYLLVGGFFLIATIMGIAKASAINLTVTGLFGVFLIWLSILLFYRHNASRIIGIVLTGMGALSIMENPLAAIISAWCCYIFAMSQKLFGPNRLTHKEVKARFKAAKVARKSR